jgi:hypothetical protein
LAQTTHPPPPNESVKNIAFSQESLFDIIRKQANDNPKNNYEIFVNEIANEMSGNVSRADVTLEIDR